VPYYQLDDNLGLQDGLVEFGLIVRRGRGRAGLSQAGLGDRSGVAQSSISRLERGRAPGLSVGRLVRIWSALGPAFPIGHCPHLHACAWQRPSASSQSGRAYLARIGFDLGQEPSSAGAARTRADGIPVEALHSEPDDEFGTEEPLDPAWSLIKIPHAPS
jgi:hypothetical protein